MIRIVFLFSIFLMACQQKPTLGVTEGGILLEDRDYRQAIPTEAVMLDTRSPFDFNTNRVPGSINLIPSDFVVKRDSLDAARRLSLYGITPDVPVVVIGDNFEDQSHLAWELAQLGIKKIETLNVQVFRKLNARVEPIRKNAIIWKPDVRHFEISEKEFFEKINKVSKSNSSARTSALQNANAARALQDRILVVQVQGQQMHMQKSASVFERLFETGIELFDSRGLLKSNSSWSEYLKRFDEVYLIDSSNEKWARAFALTQWGARSLFLVRN